ncbi:MAG: hypothetical protein DRQ44_04430, partial [Gammaproteobacteria bacterium]
LISRDKKVLTTNKFVNRRFLLIGTILASSVVVPVAASADEQAEREQAAKQVTQQFVKQLGGHLKKEMKANGPVAAIKVCKDVAPDIVNQLSIENGWRVSRVTNKVRNPSSGLPDQWESKVLAEFEALAKKGEEYSSMSKSAVVEENGQSYYRFMKPLAIKPVCLSCHGSEEDIPATVQAELAKHYPFDQAVNYKVGDLRGAVSIKQPMTVPLKKTF